MPRLFIALRPPADVRDLLIDTMEGLDGARWQDEGQLHVTLRFAGEMDVHRADDLADALAAIRANGFSIAVAGTGFFEKKGVVTSIWARIAPSPELQRLQRRVERACIAAGLEPETRAFCPHVTLARLNRSSDPAGDWLARNALLKSRTWEVPSFALYESKLSPSGSLYEAVVHYPLQRSVPDVPA